MKKGLKNSIIVLFFSVLSVSAIGKSSLDYNELEDAVSYSKKQKTAAQIHQRERMCEILEDIAIEECYEGSDDDCQLHTWSFNQLCR